MKTTPTLQEVKKIISAGEFKVVPISCELMADICTPIEVLRVLKNVSAHCYMLESVAAKETWGRYTFLGFEPKLCLTCTGGKITIGDKEFITDNPSEEIRKILDDYKSPRLADMPTFTGGLVG
ncbi:MAG: anthranilate synthase component I, partial [Selenomonadaceae bacterium]|nr:anthranilate synthase component I [Selenomonadaceae bacterium]